MKQDDVMPLIESLTHDLDATVSHHDLNPILVQF